MLFTMIPKEASAEPLEYLSQMYDEEGRFFWSIISWEIEK